MNTLDLEKILADQQLDFQNSARGILREIDILPHLQSPAVSVILGVRRCGKSTYLRQIADIAETRNSSIHYFSLDDPRLSTFQAKDFEAVYHYWQKSHGFNSRSAVILLDEVQEITGWEKWVNYFSQSKSHKVFVTGSNSKVLSSELATYLTGRHLDIYLSPLSFRELVNAEPDITRGANTSINNVLIEKLFDQFQKYGGFPRAFIDHSLSYLPHYYNDILQKDIIFRAKIRNKVAIESLAKILASETSRLINHSKIARLLKTKDEATIRKYCRLLVQAYLYYEVRCFAKSVRSQTRSLPKYYCVDHALAKSNGFWKTDDPTRNLELIVCSELLRQRLAVFYWKSSKNFEIDFLIAEGNTPITAIQVSYSLEDLLTEEREVRALDAAYRELGIQNLIVITKQERREITTKQYKIKIIPIIDFMLSNDHLLNT